MNRRPLFADPAGFKPPVSPRSGLLERQTALMDRLARLRARPQATPCRHGAGLRSD